MIAAAIVAAGALIVAILASAGVAPPPRTDLPDRCWAAWSR